MHQENHQTPWVIAGSNLSRDIQYGPVTEFELRFSYNGKVLSEDQNIIKIHEVKGQLVSRNAQLDWFRLISASRDIYEQNIEIYMSRDQMLYLRTTKEIREGQALYCWYEEQYARDLNIPYLTPLHIRGVNDYRCTNCGRVFNFPNILKLHMMPNCTLTNTTFGAVCRPEEFKHQIRPAEAHIADTLRNRKHTLRTPKYRHKLNGCNTHVNQHIDQFRPSHPPVTNLQTFSNHGPIASINCHLSYELGNSFTDLSKTLAHRPYELKASVAFIPTYRVSDHDNIPRYHSNQPDRNSIPRYNSKHDRDVNMNVDSDRELSHKVSAVYSDTEEEPMELLHKSFIEFSTKKGHMCVYCGKMYSRKYGLKIHLRTHTGYKPLKCKVCFRAFGDPSNLNKHTRLHAEGNTPYKCHKCGKVLVRRRDLVRHLSSRHPADSPRRQGAVDVKVEIDDEDD